MGVQSIVLVIILCSLSACTEEDTSAHALDPPTYPYAIIDGALSFQGTPIWFKGVNTLNTFGIGNHDLLDDWNVQIVREFIGNLREQPMAGSPIQGTDGIWLHSLQEIVDANRAHNKISILCPFGWVDESGNQTLLTGLNPSEQIYYDEYKARMRMMALQFAGQSDVWIEVWNEPYHWNNAQGYTHDMWLADQRDMLNNLRSVEGFDNIVLIPGNEQGQSEAAILSKGDLLLEGQYNVIFDLHAYEKWLIDEDSASISFRIDLLKNRGYALIFGEVGVINATGLMPVTPFLDAVSITETTTCAWLWNKNTSDQNSLLTNEGLPNNNNNQNWGSTYKAFLNK